MPLNNSVMRILLTARSVNVALRSSSVKPTYSIIEREFYSIFKI
jgi:hypothetical protein